MIQLTMSGDLESVSVLDDVRWRSARLQAVAGLRPAKAPVQPGQPEPGPAADAGTKYWLLEPISPPERAVVVPVHRNTARAAPDLLLWAL